MYKLFVDRNENFECEVTVKNASLKSSIARLMIESDHINLVFNGKIENGKCIIPIKRLKGILDENTRGKMHLEVIVEDTYFNPWQSDFIVEEHTSVKVQVNEQKETSNKPLVEVKISKTKNPPLSTPIKNSRMKQSTFSLMAAKEIVSLCERFGINKKNIVTNKSSFKKIIKEYFISNKEYNKNKKEILLHTSKILK